MADEWFIFLGKLIFELLALKSYYTSHSIDVIDFVLVALLTLLYALVEKLMKQSWVLKDSYQKSYKILLSITDQ